MKVAFFPGKNVPLKRYRPYFPTLNLYIPTSGDKPDVILCHSRGYEHAVEFCGVNNIRTKIVVMDGCDIQKDVTHLQIVFFCHEARAPPSGVEVRTYQAPEGLAHYPYRTKNTRDRILKEITE